MSVNRLMESEPLLPDNRRKGAVNYCYIDPIGHHENLVIDGEGNVKTQTEVKDNENHQSGTWYTSHVSKTIINIILTLITLIFLVSVNVTLPIFAGTMVFIGADVYVLISMASVWFAVLLVIITQVLHMTLDKKITLKPAVSFKILCVMGCMTTTTGILDVYASPPTRTPPYLQGILATSSIPFTVICRLVMLRKGISVSRTLCVCSVMVGLFITTIPQLWELPGSGSGSGDTTESTLVRVLWPLCFTFSFLPYGIMTVLCENELKKGKSNAFTLITWTQTFQVFFMAAMFWSDFIPGFGMANSPSDFSDKLHRGWHCVFSLEDSCHNAAGKAWLFYFSYCLGSTFEFLLIQQAEEAVYAAVVRATVSPMAAIFWTLFQYDVLTDHFFWQPQLTVTTAFTFGGLCIIVPAVLLYNYFSLQGESETTSKKKAFTVEQQQRL